ncbi:thioredoxin domain-containing protein [Arenibacter sp. F26102]|uniref:thioredoxin domain-containing protein n=1 Tax=Arenibacter sp. F26102 TaxID=2926416 RepID=UPI001FF3E39D|nr:thioredoxin domain-containing protein [Arenibacter sp. F26102]
MMRSYNLRFYFVNLFFVMTMIIFSCSDIKGQKKDHKFTNDLIHETSPYLLQHAHNPVNWRPWSPKALEDAKKEDKLVLVSVGYSSCHWCHVMEEETFEDEEVAKLMNENFISIKVDREERPDVDHVYMTALQLINGNGGWPLNVITLPNGKPIYGGTYHTKEQWSKVLAEVSKLYKDDPKKANEYADMVAQGIQEVNLIEPVSDLGMLTPDVLKKSVENWKDNWDLKWGGNKGSQKFMIPVNLDFLLDYAVLTDDESAKSFVKTTLDRMAWGGVYDHIAGGFYRYSTDAQWKVPHFEKMLYDNAQLISLYSKAYKVFNEPLYKKVVEETISFLNREMKNPDGGYYAAIDADSEGEEGKFYVWKEEELKSILGSDFELFAKYFNIKRSNIWENDAYVLSRTTGDAEFIKENNISTEDWEAYLGRWQKKLLTERNKRIRPNTDDKIITSWNALLITGLVDAYNAFGEITYLDKAEDVFRFIEKNSLDKNQLVHTFKKGSKKSDGFLEDYSFLANASLKLYGSTMDSTYLDFAKNMNQIAKTKFADENSGMYSFNSSNELIAKIIKTDDGVLPSPNAVMAENLLLLGHIDYNKEATLKARTMLSSMIPVLEENAYNYSKWNSLLLKSALPFYEIAVVGDDAKQLLAELQQYNLPNTLIVGSNKSSELPLFKGRYADDGTFIYVCQDHTCKLPVATTQEALEQLKNF